MEFGAGFWALILIGAAVGILIEVLFLLNLRNLLRQISPENRAMNPDYVWLNFIPLFNFVWMFIVVVKIRDSVRAEFRSRNWGPQGDFGYGAGLAYAIVSLVTGVASLLRSFVNSSETGTWGAVSGVIGLVGFVCWIVYWVKTSGLKNQLVQAGPAATYAPAAPYDGPTAPEATNPSPSPQALGPVDLSVAKCPFCGAEYRANAQFCASCGRPVV